jgi:hypothetical protein
MFKGYGYRVRVVTDGVRCSNCGSVVVPQPGRPDMKMSHPRRGTVYVEMKVHNLSATSFPFSSFDGKEGAQRAGLNKRAAEGFQVYAGIGIINDAGPRDKLVRIYFIHWPSWITVEARVREHQNSIPFQARKHMNRAVQDHKLDMEHLLQGWELQKLRVGWGIPRDHPAYYALQLEER